MPLARQIDARQDREDRALRATRARDQLGQLLQSLNLMGTGAEIGVFKGDFSEAILKHWQGERLLLVDAWRHLPDYLDSWNLSDELTEQNYQFVLRRISPFSERVRIMRMLSLEAAALIPDQSLDFVYVDANHGYRAVVSDLNAWYPKVRPGGLVSGHDYYDAKADADLEPIRNGLGPVPTKDELTSYGVKSAVDEFTARLNIEVLTTDEFEPTWFFRKP